MLVLTRKENERILMSNGVAITLVKGGIGSARLGIVAPRGVEVMREELLSQEDLARLLGPPEAPVR